uniref:Si:ch211-149l1.2 n=2 Tax=Nothobranchius korthausae TaxID=1143690 RepID=A0A1A8F6N3_9TELE
MEPFSGDTEEGTEEITGRKNSKIKSLRTRLFRRSKKSGAEANPKLSQSAGDVAIGKEMGSDEDLVNSSGMMGSRALSHDSIFLDDQTLTDSEPARVLSQENVHSKIRSLQTKLQLQKMHFGPPPLVLPIKSPEEPTSQSEEFLFFSSNDAPGERTHTKTSPQPTSPLVSPVPKSAPTKPSPLHPSSPFPVPTSSSTATIEPPLDFSAPAEFTSSLDTSAARHRLSIKPRNQRASTKKKSPTVTQQESSLNNLKPAENLEFVEEKEQQCVSQEREAEEKENVDISRRLTVKSSEASAVTSKEAPKSSSQSSSHQVDETVAPQVLRVKPHRRVDSLTAKRPHSSFIESEIREKKENLVTQVLSEGKTKVLPEQLSSVFTSRSSSALGEEDNRRQLQRPPPGSGSFHLSIRTVKNQEGERPRSGSFGGRLERTEAKNKTAGGAEEKKETDDFKSTQLKGSPVALERLGQEGSPSRRPASLWDRKTNLKKTETATAAPNVPAEPAAVQTEEMESSQERVDDAEEAKEEDGKTPFGVKLRSTSLSLKFRSDSSSPRHSNTEVSEDQDPRRKNQETSNSTHARMPETPPTNTTSVPRAKDPALSGVALSVKQSASLLENPPAGPTEAQTTSSHNKEAETAPQTSSSEVSWMTLAMEKTRSLQQLFTSRFPKESPGVQTTARPQAQAQSKPQADTATQAQTIKAQQSAHQPSAGPVKEESESRIQEQVVKPSDVAKQQKIILKESQMSKQPNEVQPAQIPQRTTQSPLRSASQTTSQLSQGSASQSLTQSYLSSAQQQPPSWPSRGFQPALLIKSTTPPQTSEMGVTSAPALDSASDKEGTVHKESPSLFSRRTIWTGSVAERAVFLEKRGEWTTPPSMTGVETRKAQIEVQTSADTPTMVKHPAVSKDTMAEIRQVVKTAESSPIKVPEKPPEDKWLRKNMGSPSSPSSLHTRALELQSMSDSSQPSWMELAKRKSMAWSDKTMD